MKRLFTLIVLQIFAGFYVLPQNQKIRSVNHSQQSRAPFELRSFGFEDPIPQGMARIILAAGDIWGDGSGYQMLLDEDAIAYGTIIPVSGPLTNSGDAPQSIYDQFEYKIPENADGTLTTQNIVFNNAIAIDIPVGVYDYCITNPLPGDRMWIAWGDYSRGNDVVFEENKIYQYTVFRTTDADGIEMEVIDPSCLISIDIPYFEDFEQETFSSCWRQEYIQGNNRWQVIDAYSGTPGTVPNESNFKANFYHASHNVMVTKLILPMFDLSALSSPGLSFWHTQRNWAGDQDELRVYYKNATDGAWILLAEYTEDIYDWQEEIIALPNPTATYWIAFEGSTHYGHGIQLDDIFIGSTCPKVQNLAVAQENNNVLLSWDAIENSDFLSYTIYKDEQLLATNITTTSYTDENVEKGDHQYCIAAVYDECGESVLVCRNILVTESGDCDAPENLNIQTHFGFPYQVYLSWIIPESNEGNYPMGVNIYRNGLKLNNTPLYSNSYYDHVPEAGNYTYNITMVWDNYCESAVIGQTVVIECADYCYFDLFSPQTALNEITITWNIYDTPEAISAYQIYRNGAHIATVFGTNYTDSGLPKGWYEYGIAVVYENGCVSQKQYINVLAIEQGDCPKPQDINSTLHYDEWNGVYLYWNWPEQNGAAFVMGFNVYRDGIRLNDQIIEWTSYFDIAPGPGTYQYGISAVWNDGCESEQEELSITIDAPLAIKLYGYRVFDNGSTRRELVSFMSNNPSNITIESNYQNGSSIRCGEYFDGNIYAYSLDANNNPLNFIKLSENWEEISSTSVTAFAQEMAYDYSSYTMYGIRLHSSYSELCTVNLETGTLTSVADMSLRFIVFACSLEGQLYGIAFDGNLYAINKTNGTTTLIGATGFIPSYAQSMAFDHNSGKLFWAHMDQDSNGKLIEIDPATGVGTNYGTLGNNAEVVMLYTPYSNNEAPAAPIAFTATPAADGSLSCLLSWTNPELNYEGNALTELTSVVIKRNNEIIHTIENPVMGATESWTDTPSTYNDYVYTIYGVNSFGDGVRVTQTVSFVPPPATIPYTHDFEDTTENAKWSLLNGTQTNKWYIGDVVSNGGSQSLYISNTGTTHTYDITATSYVYAYRTLNFVEAGRYYFRFDWMAYGEGNWDNLRAFLVPATIPLSAGNAYGMSGASNSVPDNWIALSLTLGGRSAWQSFNTGVTVPDAGLYSLVFFWKNDPSLGTQPPATVDNIHIEFFGSPLAGIYTIDNTQPTAGRNFNTFEDAIEALNTRGISDAVTFEVISGQVHNIALTDSRGLRIVSGGTADKPVIFRKSGTEANPLLKVTGASNASNDLCLFLDGVNHITFDGIDVENAGTIASWSDNDHLEYAFYLSNTNNISIINCNIKLSQSSYYTSYGIYTTGSINYLHTENVNIQNAYYGYYFQGSGTENTISKSVIDSVSYGIYVPNSSFYSQNNFTIKESKITNASTGIYLNYGKNQQVYNNVIHAKSTGIYLEGSTTTDTVYLAHNTVYIPATTSTTYCLRKLSSSGKVGLYNNIFINKSTSSTSYCFYNSSDNAILPESNNNIYYKTNGYIYRNSSVSKSTVNEYIELLGDGRENNSHQVEVPFISTTSPFNFNIQPDVPTKAESGGQPLSWVLTDIDGNARNSETPDIGAYEFEGINIPFLQGVYTIDNTQPTANRNFNTFEEAINALNTCSISDTTIFETISGQIHNIALTDYRGLRITSSGSADKPIIFRKSGTGANPLLKVTGTSNNADVCFYLDAVNYITFDGLDIENAGTASNSYLERAFYLYNASNISLLNCNIRLQNASNNYAVYSSGNVNALYTDNVTIQNAYYGYSFYSSSGTENFISKNVIDSVSYGIYVYDGSSYSQNNFTIKENKITNANTGIRLSYGKNQQVYNNVIHAKSTGIYLYYLNTTDTVYLAHNTVYIPATTSTTYCLLISSSNGKVGLYNNIFINKSTSSSSPCFYNSSDNAILPESNNNIYYRTNGYIYRTSSVSKFTVHAYIELLGDGRESNSCQVEVPFISTTSPFNFNIQPDVPTKAESGGQPLSWVLTDMDGNARNHETPDIGAYEFEGIYDDTDLSPLHGIYTIDITLPTVDRNFNSFEDAIEALNSRDISDAVTFEVVSGQVHNIALTNDQGLRIVSSGSADKPIIFRKSGTGANPLLKVTGTSNSTDVCFYLDAVNYITFDGLDIENAGTASNSYLERAFYLYNASNISLLNCNIRLRNTSTNYAVYSSGIVNALYTDNVTIQNADYGYYFSYSSGTENFISKNVIDNVSCGIYVYNGSSYSQNNFTIKENKITNASTGIQLNYGKNQQVYNNVIHATTTGIYLYALNTTDTVYLAHNTVYIPTTTSAADCLRKLSSSGKVGLYNNIFINKSTSSTSYCFYNSSDNAILPESNNNIYYCEQGAIYNNASVAVYTIKEYIELLADGRESNSAVEEVPFISTVAPLNLNIQADVPTKAESGGQVVSWISTDVEGNPRYGATDYIGTGTAPDIGAYEFEGIYDETNLLPLSGVYTIDITQPTAGRNFNSFEEAIALLNTVGISDAVTFEVVSGQVHHIALTDYRGLRIVSGGSADKPIIFRKSGTGANPLLKVTGTSNNTDVCFYLDAVNYITFDGLDIENAGTASNSYLEQAFYLYNASNISILNCNIRLRNASNNYAVYSGGNVNALYTDNVTIQNASYGYCFDGSGTENFISKNVIDSVSYGIYVSGTQNNLAIKQSKITNANTGIRLYYGKNQQVYNNVIHAKSTGIYLEGSTTTDTVYLAHNTVYIPTTTSAADCLLKSSSDGKVGLYNNIFINKSTSSRSYCFYNSSDNAILPESNNNIYYKTNGYIYRNSSSSVNTLEAYRILLGDGRESNSVEEEVPFISAVYPFNFDVRSDMTTAAESGGQQLAWITTDIEGNLRYGADGYAGSGSAPDIGAYEFEGKGIFFQSLCSGDATEPVDFTAFYQGANVSWAVSKHPNHTTGYITSGTNMLPSMELINGSDQLDTLIYALTPATGTPLHYTIFIRPQLQIGNFSNNMLPADSAAVQRIPVTFSWQAVAGAMLYDIYIWSNTLSCPAQPTKANLQTLQYSHSANLVYGNSYKWKVVAKNLCAQVESAIFSFDLRLLPNLHVSDVSVGEIDESTRSVTVTWDVVNDGEGDVIETAHKDRIWIVSSLEQGTSGGTAHLLAEINNVKSLAAGESYSNSANVTIPGRFFGTYYIIVTTDMRHVYSIDWAPAGNTIPIPYQPSLSGTPYPYLYADGYWYYSKIVAEAGENAYRSDNFFYIQVEVPQPPIDQFIITATAGVGGTITPSGAVSVDYGTNKTFTFSPLNCYQIDQVLINGVNNAEAVTNGTYTFTNVTEDQTIEVSFKRIHYTITATSGAGGTISPSGTVSVSCGTDKTVTFTPSDCYQIDQVLINGVNNAAAVTAGSYTFSNISGNQTIAVSFKRIPYMITATAGAGGTISPSGAVPVDCGTNKTFTFSPLNCYQIDQVLINGVNNAAAVTAGSYTFSNISGNQTIAVSFKRIPYMITATAGAGGTISPSGTVSVDCGSDKTFTFTPSDCYQIDQVLINGVNNAAAVTAGSYTFSNISGNQTIAVSFKRIPYMITATAGAGGTISPSGAVPVDCGSDKTFTFTPSDCYQIDQVLIDGVNNAEAVTNGTYTFTNITDNHSIFVTFKETQTYTIIAIAGTDGNISPNGEIVINHGENQIFTFSANDGYKVDSLLIDGINTPDFIAGGSYTFENVTENHVIEVIFKPLPYVITAIAGVGGIIDPNGEVWVDEGDEMTFIFIPDSCYRIDSVYVDGVYNPDAVTKKSYTFTNITDNHFIFVTFKETPTYTIIAIAGTDGNISPDGEIVINHGENQIFTFSANDGYKVDSLLIDGINTPDSIAGGSYTFENVTENHVIEVIFKPLPYVITAIAGTGGTITPSGNIWVDEGDEMTFIFIPDSCYQIDSVYVDGVYNPDAVTEGSYTFINITDNHFIFVTFKETPTYTIIAIAGTDGNISPNGEIVINHGENQIFTFSANDGYKVDSLLIDGINTPDSIAGGSYTFENVTENHVIEVIFKPLPYVITAIAGTGGTITPSGNIWVDEGDEMTFIFIPDSCYRIDSVYVDGVYNPDAVTEKSYTFINITDNHFIFVTFKETTYSITASTNDGGTITPSGTQLIDCGVDQTYIFAPDAIHKIYQVLIDGENNPEAVTNGTYTFNNVVEDHTIEVQFKLLCGITTITSSGGTIISITSNEPSSPDGVFLVEEGTSITVTAIPQDTCYQIAQIFINGVYNAAAVASGSYTFENVTENQTIEANFELIPYIITATAGTGGTITPSGEVSVECGAGKQFIFTPDSCYQIDGVYVDGVYNSRAVMEKKYVFTNMSDNHTIEVTFKPISVTQYIITATAGENGTIDPEGEITVTEGDHQTFTFVANPGYEVDQLLIDEVNVFDSIAGGSYTFVDVMEDHSIEVTFKSIPPTTYTITATAGANGTISPNGNILVNVGDNQNFTFTADNGYEVHQLLIDGVHVPDSIAGGSYTFKNVTEDHTIAVTFKVIAVGEQMLFTWNADANSEKSFTLRATDGEEFVVDWGDGTTDTYTGNEYADISLSHTYNSTAAYFVSVSASTTDGHFTYLNCDNNQLTALDIRQNRDLMELYCSNNQLTALDVSTNTALSTLWCPNNQLTALDVNTNTALSTLWCPNNQLTALDVSTNTALRDLYCYNNQLTALDVSNNTALTYLDCSYNQLTALDVSTSTALTYLDCYNNQLTALDVSTSTALTYLDCYNNQLTALDVSQNSALITLYCDNNQLTALDVSQNSALITLYCDNNQLTALDLSGATALTYLYCYNNPLTALDVSGATALTYLYCYNNQLTALDVSTSTALSTLWCDNNQLTFSTLPLPPYSDYWYTPQAKINGGIAPGFVDLSSEYNIDGNITVYTWYELNGTTETEISSGYTDHGDGTFTFGSEFNDKTLRCKMTNATFPDFTASDPLVYEVTIGTHVQYTITATAGAGGSIDPEGEITVTEGDNQTFTFIANNGYEVDELLIDEVNVPDSIAGGSYTFVDVTEDHTIEVTFKSIPPTTSTITATAGANGTISPNGNILVNVGDNQNFTFTANNGYEVHQLLIDGVHVPDSIAGGSYTFVDVMEDHTIEVTFKSIPPATYIITATAGENGTIDPEGEITVTEGDNQTFTFTANNGYEVDELLIDEVNVPDSIAGGSYTFVEVTEDHTIEVTFKPIPVTQYIISASAGENGTIDPEGEITVTEGDNQTFTFIANNGYEVDELLIDEVNVPDSIAGGSYTFVDVTEDHTIEVTFKSIPVTQYTITATAGENGSIDPEGEITVTEGDNQTFTFIANNGYEVDELLIDEVNVPDSIAGGSYTFENVTEDHTIEVTFKPIPVTQYTISASAGENGNIDPEGEITVTEGDNQTFTFIADNGYEVDQLLIDEVNVPDSIAGGSYTFVDVTEDHTIEVTFKSIPVTQYTITATAGENGSIDPEGEITVIEGDHQTFTFIADNGYEVYQLLVDEVNVPDSIAGGSYTFVDVMEDHSIEVTFKPIPPATYIITATAGENGSIDPEGEITVTEGDNQTFTFTANNGYEVDELLIDEVNVPDSIAGGSYTFVEVTEDHTIEVTFKPIPVTQYIISASAGENGTIDPEGEITVTEGDNQTFTFIANNGYEVDELLIDEVNVPDSIAGGSYTFVDVTEDHTIEVTFKSIPVTQYTITATAGENGSIDPEGEITVTEGDNQTFTFIANNGYEVDELLIDEVNVPDSIAGGSYTFENVTEDHTIEVTFKPIPVTQYTISASAGENGNIDPEGEITVTEGDNQTFTFIADNGYEVDQLLIDEVNVPDSIAGGSYTFVDVTEDHTIEVTFKSIPVTQYTITATAGENGSIDPEGEITVIEGDHQTFTFIADNGYEVYQLLVDEVNVPDSIAGGSYTFVDVMEDHSIEVTFKPIPPATYIITATAGENGSIDPEGEITVTEGDNQTFTFTADNGYEVDQLLVDEVNVPDSIAGGSYTFENVTEDHSIEITFKAINVPVTGVRVDPSALTLYGISSTAQLAATIMPANASNKNVSWSSDDESIVVVSPNGQITAVAIGSAVITVTTEDGEYTAICEVTVIASDGAVSGVELLDCPENGWLNVEETLSLQVIVIPEDAANKNVTWRSTNPNTAIVDASGTVTAKGIGVTYIIVKTMDGGFSDSCHIQVIQPVTGIRLTPSQMTLMLEEQKQLTARVLPENASISDIIWSSENETIAMVNASGKVTGLSPGTTNIIATTVDGGFEAMCQVTVVNAYAPATGITVTPKTLAINKGETAILTAEVKPANASQMVTWSSNNPAVATVAADGTVTALAAGKATITAKTDNNYSATCAVTVTIPIDSIVVTPDEWTLPLKGAKALKATVYPSDASNKTIKWSSANTALATVSATGVVTAKNINGVVEIYATNTASGKKGICVITVGTGIPAAPPMDISEENTTNHIVLYPNPTVGKLKIESGELRMNAIKVFDITGRLVLEMNHVDDNEVILDLSGYAVGVYFINVDGKTMKVVKK